MIQLPTVASPPIAPADRAATRPTAPVHPRPSQASLPAPAPAARPGPPSPARSAERKFGLFRTKSNARSEQESRDRDRLRTPSRSPRRIAVVGLKGGVGKTTLSVLLTGIYSQVRGEPVLLLDADPTFGSLLLRSGVAPAYCARDLAGRGDPGDLAILAPYLTQSAPGTWVLPSGLDPGESALFDEATYSARTQGWYGGASPQPHVGTGAAGGGLASGPELAIAMRVPHST